ncbi:MAG: FAD-binding protein [Adlercreutzia sp.]
METNLSRRGFLTGAAAAGALAAMGLAGCAPTPAAEGGTKTADTGAAAATSWRDKPEMPTEFVETVDADIVVVGAGNGGLVAATTAAQNGAKVIVLEGRRHRRRSRGHRRSEFQARPRPSGRRADAFEPRQPDPGWRREHAHVQDLGREVRRDDRVDGRHAGPQGHALPFEWHCPDDPHAYYPAMCYNPCIGSTTRTARTTTPTPTWK